MAPATEPSRGPGRPGADAPADVRGALIRAARELCVERGLDAASSKAIADRAGVNPAMINYYFESKEGLCRQMMVESMQPVLAQFDAAEQATGAGGWSLQRFLAGYMTVLSQNPWLPQLIVREVLPENGRFRELVFRGFGERAAGVMSRAVAGAQKDRSIDPQLDPQLVMISIVSIAVFPFLAAPMLENVLGADTSSDAFVADLVAHSSRLLQRGLGGEGSR